jgi:tetratricopeptide (TPR) repeat protein
MQRFSLHGRALLSALAMVACLLVGCAAPVEKKATTTTTPSQPAAPPVPDVSSEALTHYAAGVSLELRQGAIAAVPEFEKAFELDPQNAVLAGRIAQTYLAQKERDKALAILDKAIAANPKAPEPWLWIGVARRSADDLPQAIIAFQEALKRKPDFLPAIRALVEVYFQKENVHDIPPLLEQTFNQTSTDATFWMGLGDLYGFVLKQKPSLTNQISSRHPADCYEKARANNPRDPEILLRVAESQMAANNFTAAADAYSMLLKIRPDLTQLRDRLARAYLQADQKEKAITAFKDILKREPLRYDIHNSIADLYQELNKDTEAATHFQSSLDINPNQIEVVVHLALVQLRRKRFDDAHQLIATARKRFPRRFQLAYLDGLIYAEQKLHPNAIAAYTEAEQLLADNTEDKPTSPFYFMYGAACERGGQFDKAAALMKKSIALEPKNHNALNYLGYMYADKNQNLDEALDLLNKALAIQPDNPAYLDSLGWIYYRLGRFNDALKQLRRSVELCTKEPDATIFDHLAETLLQLGQRDEALANLRKAVKLEPDNKTLAEKLKKWTDGK